MRHYLTRTVLSLTVAIILAFTTFSLAVAQEYTVIDLGTLGGSWSGATKINDHGEVVGASDPDDPDVDYYAFLWTEKDGMVDLGNFLPITYGAFSIATDINIHGQVIGEEVRENPSPTIQIAFLWTEKDGMQHFFPTLWCDANALNDKGQIVGRYREESGMTAWSLLPSIAFLWTKQNGMQPLGTLGGDYSSANDINNRGEVVGSSDTVSGDGNSRHPFLWTADEGMIDLETLGGGFGSATAINKNSEVCGFSSIASGENHAFLWTPTEGIFEIVSLSGRSYCRDINDRGQAVGEFNTGGGERAFIWDRTNGMQDLNDLIPADTDWTLTGARGINKKGQIVASGYLNGDYHALLLNPVK